MSRKRITVGPRRIPKSKRLLESARRLANGLRADLSGRSSARKAIAGKRGEPNPWPKCPTCFHRVPQLCDYCERGRAGVAPKHVQSCCPGPCQRCLRCRLECPGACSRCGQCADRCGGHDNKEGQQ